MNTVRLVLGDMNNWEDGQKTNEEKRRWRIGVRSQALLLWRLSFSPYCCWTPRLLHSISGSKILSTRLEINGTLQLISSFDRVVSKLWQVKVICPNIIISKNQSINWASLDMPRGYHIGIWHAQEHDPGISHRRDTCMRSPSLAFQIVLRRSRLIPGRTTTWTLT